jgi:hypothetical protein
VPKATGNKAKASKDTPKDPAPKRAPSAGHHPVRSPLDDGIRSQMLGLSSNLSLRRRSGSPLLSGLSAPPSRKRKATMSLDNVYTTAAGKSSPAEDSSTSASAAGKSSSAEDTSISASAADKSSSVEGTPILPLGIRISNAVDEKLEQLNSSRTPAKEHSAMEAEKGTANEKGNTPLSAAEIAKASGTVGKAKSSRTSLFGPWGDLEDEEETKSSEVPSLLGKPSLLPALNAESSHPLNRDKISSIPPKEVTGITSVSNRHDFNSPSSSPKRIGETSGGSSPRSGATTIRSGGIPEKNEQWTAQLAKNLAGDMRRSKSPPGTPQSHELEDEGALVRPTQTGATSARIPLDFRLTEEELRLREARKALERIINVVANVMNVESLSSTVYPKSCALRDLNKNLQAISNVDDDLMTNEEAKASATLFNANLGTLESSSAAKPLVNRGEGTEEDRARWVSFMKERDPSSRSEPVIDVTGETNEGESVRPNFEAEMNFLRELDERHKLGLLDSIEDTYVAFRTILGEPDVKKETRICSSPTPSPSI